MFLIIGDPQPEVQASLAWQLNDLQALHLITQGKHSVSALQLKRQLGVHYETAWAIKYKLMQVMLERESQTVLSGRIEMDDAYMGGERP